MAIDWDDIPVVPDIKPERQRGEPSGEYTPSKLMEMHPQSGGPYGGRDNALTALVGHMRERRWDYEMAAEYAQLWNQKHCDPPLEPWEVSEKLGRAWADWTEGARELLTQQVFASELLADKLKALEPKEEPELEIWDWWRFKEEGMNCKDEEWIAENMIIHKGLHFIAAASGSGKSWLGIDLAIACASGRPWCHFIETAQTKVLYINEEIETRKFWGRFCMMHPTDIPDLHIIQKKNTKVDKPLHMNKIVRYVKEHEIKLVVVDTFVRIHSMDENDNGAVAKLYDRFQEIIDAGAAVVVLHHNKKLAPGSAITQDTMRGASDLAAQADMVLSIYHDIDAKTYDVKTVKHRHIGEDDWVNFLYRLNSEQPGHIAIEQISNAGAESELLDRIVQYVSDNPGKTKSAICDGIKKGRNLVWDTVDDAVELQLIECRQKKYYRR